MKVKRDWPLPLRKPCKLLNKLDENPYASIDYQENEGRPEVLYGQGRPKPVFPEEVVQWLTLHQHVAPEE
jgi:hypothetical protein